LSPIDGGGRQDAAPAVFLFFHQNNFKKGRWRMDAYKEILRALGRIEGEFVEIRKLSERVRRLEIWVAVVMALMWLWRLR
jgi:hypothetical protein